MSHGQDVGKSVRTLDVLGRDCETEQVRTGKSWMRGEDVKKKH